MDLVDISALEHSHQVACMAEPHIHSEIEVNLVLTGAMTYRFNGEALTLPAGRLVVFWGAVPHQVTLTRGETRFGCMYLPIERFLGLPVSQGFARAVLAGRMIEAASTDELDQLRFARWHQDVAARRPQLTGIAQDELASRLRRVDLDGWRPIGGAAAPVETVGPIGRMAKAQRMARYIAEHLAEPLTTAEIARAAGLHPNYAMTLFRDCLGLTINQYIARHRRAVAQAMLLSTDREITQIAFAAGFGSLSRFYEVFRAEFGTTPKAYRAAHR